MSKLILAPSVLSADFMNLKAQVDEIIEGGAEYIHFDVMDGHFVPNISFGLPVLASMSKSVDKVFDVHLMISDPDKYIPEFAKKGADIITFHVEAVNDLGGTIRLIHECGAKAGVSVKPATPVEVLYPYLNEIDMVLIMSVEPGFGGQSFSPGSLDKISALREECSRRGLDMDIEVDGGIGASNAQEVVKAGANILVAGSAVFKGDVKGNTESILAAMRNV